MKRMEAGSGRDLADIEMPVLRLLEIEEGHSIGFPVSEKYSTGFFRLGGRLR